VKTKKPKKEVNDSSAFSQLVEQVEKERKRARIIYFSGIVVLTLSLFSFLLFSPIRVPAFSDLGDRILGREEVKEEETQVEETEEEVEEKPEETPEETSEETPPPTTVPSTYKAPTTTPSTYTTDSGLYDNCVNECEGVYNSSIGTCNSNYGIENGSCEPKYTNDFWACGGLAVSLINQCVSTYMPDGFLSPSYQDDYYECLDDAEETGDNCREEALSSLSKCYDSAKSSADSCYALAGENRSLCYTKCGKKY